MSDNSPERSLATLLAVLSDPVRLTLIDALRGGEQSVGDLTRCVAIAQSGVSRHLHILTEAGVLTMQPAAQRRLYRLRPEPFLALAAWCQAAAHAAS